MSIDIGAALIVGLPFDEMEFEDEDIIGEAYGKGLDYASPYFDADPSECVFGLKVGGATHACDEVTDLVGKVTAAKEEFHKITGLEAKVFVSPHVW